MIKPCLAVEYEKERDKNALRFPYYAQPKMDGIRVLISFSDGRVKLTSRNGNEFNLPHIIEAITPYLSSHQNIVLDGELYSHDLTFSNLCSIIRSANSEDKEMIKLYLFDYYNSDYPRMKYKDRYKALSDLSGVANIIIVENITVKSHKGVERALESFLGLGYEGVMIKSISSHYKEGRSNTMMKYKKFIDNEFEVKQIVDNTIICYTSAGVAFSVLGSAKIGDIVTIRYQEMTSKGSLRFPRLIGIRDYE